ncbi:hypothetical protein CN345_20725 [Bacillus thuringiensis]|uniref:hypothetical protein n=1 Tax=Bacillus cereus group TaxID=86661 RepID=UPI000BF5EFC4|nr:hypothetical protein [Bacillus thuringiensis]MCQ6342565.1 hypothetical protein [Bacillus cereus]PEZ28655.1 hypothetical protein CN345_20725 [Bacillus thuringiensis]
MKIKGIGKAIRNFAVAAILTIPSVTFAAGDNPQGALQKVIDGITGLFLILAPSVGGLALIWYGIQHYFAGDSHKKSELRDSMKSTVIISVLIMIASGLIKWVVGLAS